MDKYDVLFKGIREIINKYDPINLVSGGAPEDEYDGEVIKIIKLLPENKEKLRNDIYKIFINSFNQETAGDRQVYDSIAGEVFQRYASFFKQ